MSVVVSFLKSTHHLDAVCRDMQSVNREVGIFSVTKATSWALANTQVNVVTRLVGRLQRRSANPQVSFKLKLELPLGHESWGADGRKMNLFGATESEDESQIIELVQKLESYGRLVALDTSRHRSGFSRSEFAALENLRSLRSLRIHQASDLQFVSRMVDLEELEITTGRLADLQPLRDLRKLKTLKLPQATVTVSELASISPCLPVLEHLQISCASLENLECFQKFPQLVEVSLEGSTDNLDVRPLRFLRKLKSLRIPVSMFDYSRIAQLTSLERVHIYDEISSSWIRSMEKLAITITVVP